MGGYVDVGTLRFTACDRHHEDCMGVIGHGPGLDLHRSSGVNELWSILAMRDCRGPSRDLARALARVVSGADPGSAVGHPRHSCLCPRRGLLTDQGGRQRSKVKPAPARYPTTEVSTTPVVEVERIHVHTHAHQGVNTIAFVRHVGTWASRSELMYRTNGIRVSVYLRRDFASLSVKWRRDNRPHQVLPARAMTEGEASVTARVGHMADSASGQREADPGGVSLASIGASSGAHAVVDHGARAVTAEVRHQDSNGAQEGAHDLERSGIRRKPHTHTLDKYVVSSGTISAIPRLHDPKRTVA
jgi:hypothetical protein